MGFQEKINQIKTTALFNKWVINLKDASARAMITKRIERAERGNFGDHKSLGEGLFEMRITVGAGYRLYYGQIGNTVYLLLLGGNKATQTKDIAKAKEIWQFVNSSQFRG